MCGSILASLRVPNRTLWIVCALTLCLLLVILCVQWLMQLFYFGAMPWSDVLAALALGLSCCLWFEAIKLMHRRRKESNPPVATH